MSRKSVNINELKNGDVFYITGTVRFSRVAKKIDGEALIRDIERQRRNGARYIIDKPYTFLTLENAGIKMHDPNNPTKVEIYGKETLYQATDKNTGVTSWCANAKNTGKYVPTVLVKNATNPSAYDEVKLEHELAVGLKVTMCVSIFNSGKGNNGAKLDTILVEEPLRYYSNNSVVNQLEAMGITVNRMPEEEPNLGMTDVEPDAEIQAPVANVPTSPFSTAPAAPPVAEPPVSAPTAAEPPIAPPVNNAPVMPNPYVDPYAIADNSGTPGGIVFKPGEDSKY